MRRWSPDRWPAAVLVGSAGTLLLVLFDLLVRDERTPRGDDQIYELMASDPHATHTFPFAYRFLFTDLVHVLPFSHDVSFTLLAWACSGAATGVLYVLLRRFDVPVWFAIGLALTFAVTPYLLLVSLRQGRNPDAATILVMMVGALAIVDRRPVLLAAVVAVGALVRESTMFLVPFAYAHWAERWWDRRAVRDTLVAGLPGLAAYLVVRAAVPTVGREYVVGYGESLLRGRWTVLERGFREGTVELRRLALALGPLWLCYPFAVRGLRYARSGLVLVGLLVVSMTFALDWGRIAFLAAPVVFVAGGWVLRDRRRLAIAMLAALAVLDVGYAAYMQLHGVEHGIDTTGLPPYPVQ